MKKSIFTLICSVLFMFLILVVPVHAQEACDSDEKATVSELSNIRLKFVDGTTYTYTGKPKTPKVKAVIFEDSNGQVIETTEITVKEYQDNVKIGKADVVISIAGYEGVLKIEDAFEIVLGDVKAIKATLANFDKINLKWSKVKGADGYVICRSTKKTSGFKAVKTIENGTATTYQDASVKFTKVYYYKVKAYSVVNGKKVFSKSTTVAKQKAQLQTAVITTAKRNSYLSIVMKWKNVSGADGYHIYRAAAKNGAYEKIAIVNNKSTWYEDKNCACGKTYYYKVAAYRMKDGKKYFGEKSEAVAARTTPNRTKFTKETMSGEKHAALVWEKVVGATGYTIYRSTKKDSGYEAVKHIKNGTTLKWKNTGLKAKQVYYFKVRPYVVRNGEKVYGAYSKPYKKELLSVKIENVKKYTYVSYRYGGCTTKGWDCSGFTQWATRYLHGVEIEKHSAAQARGGKEVNKKNRSTWKQGDILAYSSGGRVNHVALYLGDGEIMHALNTKHDTVIQDVDYYEDWDKKNNLKCVRRYF